MTSEKLQLWDSTVPIVGRYFGRDYTFETNLHYCEASQKEEYAPTSMSVRTNQVSPAINLPLKALG
jgi:hypothetical protein